MDTVVILSETGELQLTSLSRHALFHAVSVLLPNQSMTAVLPKSGSRKVENLCNELPLAVSSRVRKKASLPNTGEGNPLIASLEIHKFLEHAVTVGKFTESLETHLLELSGGELDADKLHTICWTVYESEKGQEVSIRHWFSPTCTYRMWLVFCCVQEQEQYLTDTLSALTTNEVIKRLGELCGYTWNEAYSYIDTAELTFPQYLRAIATYFTRLGLEMSLTCEVIGDMVDEIVHGVLKKGCLLKKGHKRKNWKRRWFVLQRTIIRYYESRDNMTLKGQLVLNSKTDVKSMSDKGKRKCLFEVTCGHTGTPFEISADDQRTKHDWILAIKKAIALAKVLDGSSKQDDFADHLSGFYLLKYGTPQPYLNRQDSTVRNMKYYATFKDQRKRLSGRKKSNAEDSTLNDSGSYDSSAATTPQEEYLPMNPIHRDGDIYSDESSDEDSYTMMTPIREGTNSRSSECLSVATPDNETITDWQKGLSQSYCQNPSINVSSQDGDSSDENEGAYDEATPMAPRYKLTPRTMDKELGGYIDVTKVNRNKRPVSVSLSLDSKLSTVLHEEEDDEIRKVSRSVTLDPVPETDQAPSSSSYMTIIRGEDSPEEITRRAKTMETVLSKTPPPVPSHRSSVSLNSDCGRGHAPPPVQPRPSKPTPTSPSRSKHNSTSSLETGNSYHSNSVPPLPPR